VKKPVTTKTRILILTAITALTLTLHYGWLVEPLFGHVHWLHSVHGRFCYIPIVMAAAWFGLRGGLVTAGIISFLLLPYIFGVTGGTRDITREVAEIIFYFAIAILSGVLVEREFAARRKQQEAQLKVERSQKLSLVGQLAAGVAHEIKNPLASIKGAADILSEEETAQDEREEFKGILRNEIKRIDSTVTEFLKFARPKETKKERVNLSKIVMAAIRQVQAQANRQGVSIDTFIEDGIDVNGDPEKLHQMILNLILNAIQASREGGAIRVEMNDEIPSAARLEIVDKGAGIKQNDIEHIFEPFFTTKSSGTGLGLAIVKDIVDNHNGEISIDSEEGKGTKILVTIPRVRSSA
jgi:signal transduction histidine kinase